MIGLISTPSTCDGAEDERRQQVAPAARSDDERREAAGALGEVIADGGQLVAQIRGVGDLPGALRESVSTPPNRCP